MACAFSAIAQTAAPAATQIKGTIDLSYIAGYGTSNAEYQAFLLGCSRQEVREEFVTKDGRTLSLIDIRTYRGRKFRVSWTGGASYMVAFFVRDASGTAPCEDLPVPGGPSLPQNGILAVPTGNIRWLAITFWPSHLVNGSHAWTLTLLTP